MQMCSRIEYVKIYEIPWVLHVAAVVCLFAVRSSVM